MTGGQATLFADCALPSCQNPVNEPGDACLACVTFWGPYIGRRGELSAWHPGYVPACGHGFWWWRRGKCDRCGSTETVTIR